MRYYPRLVHADSFQDVSVFRILSNGKRVYNRPMYLQGSIMQRLRLAWGVFTGRYDALSWYSE